MGALVIYDSRYGHTEKIAHAIGEAVEGQVLQVDDVSPADLEGVDLLLVGSPTHGGFPTEGIHDLVKATLGLEGVRVAVFDTRTKRTMFGYAAPKIARNLEKGGGVLVAPPEGFFVLGRKGPLKEGEIERAADWAERIASLDAGSPIAEGG